ncbi:MAG: hypothetical protein IJT83_12660 [Victivallales bacterium]|nr:hypothetical protein [Victivallales bacterium]
MMKRALVIAFLLVAALSTVSAYDTTPFQFGIWPSKFQIVPEEINVSGLKINFPFGGNDYIQGVDLGIASTSLDTSALQINILVNRAHENFSGLQFAILNQAGRSNGIILGGFNITDESVRGIEVGIINSSMECRGLQVGLINYTEMMTGLQIGLINIITGSVVPVFPIINFCF